MKKIILILTLIFSTTFSFGQVYDQVIIKDRFDDFIKGTPTKTKSIVTLNNYRDSEFYILTIETKGLGTVNYFVKNVGVIGTKDSPVDVTGQGRYGYMVLYIGFYLEDTSINGVEKLANKIIENENCVSCLQNMAISIEHRTIVSEYAHVYECDMWMVEFKDRERYIVYRDKYF